MIYTSRYANPELKIGNYTLVRISLGTPRWRTGYTIAGAIRELMPSGLLNINDIGKFCRLYYERLDSFGVDPIKQQLKYYESFGRPVVLLCFEDIRKGGENWCHRTAFAKWWKSRTGEDILELKDDSIFKVEGEVPDMPEVDTLSIYENGDQVEKLIIKVVYSTWEGEGGDMYYTVDRSTGKNSRISDTEARNLLVAGKAELVVDYDSVPKIRFVLAESPNNRAYKIDRTGKEKEISFKNAQKLVIEGRATIKDIEIEK